MSKEVHDYIQLIRIDNISRFLEKRGISHNKLLSEDGRSFIIDKPLAELFKDAGVDSKLFNYEQYNNWYISGFVNSSGSINEAEEFLKHYGNGNVKKGLKKLKKEMNKESLGTDKLSAGVDIEAIEENKNKFIDYLEDQLN